MIQCERQCSWPTTAYGSTDTSRQGPFCQIPYVHHSFITGYNFHSLRLSYYDIMLSQDFTGCTIAVQRTCKSAIFTSNTGLGDQKLQETEGHLQDELFAAADCVLGDPQPVQRDADRRPVPGALLQVPAEACQSVLVHTTPLRSLPIKIVLGTSFGQKPPIAC